MSLGAYAMRQLWPDERTIFSQDPIASGSSLTDYPGMFHVGFIGMYLHGFEKRILPDINKRSSLGKRWEQAEA